MDLQCPKCLKRIAGALVAPNGKVCPHCGAALPLSGGSDLLSDILSESQRIEKAEVSGEKTPSVSPVARRRPAASGRAAAGESSPGARRAAAIVLLCLLVIGAAGYFAVTYIQRGIRNDAARDSINRLETGRNDVDARMKEAIRFREARSYKNALDAYGDVLNRATPLLAELNSGKADAPGADLRARAQAIQSALEGYIQAANAALEDAELKRFASGQTEYYEGEWVTPEEKKRRFEEKMAKEGRRLYEGDWLTEAEIHERKGEVFFQGRWMSKEEYSRLIVLAPEVPLPPVTTTTTQPKPPAGMAGLDPAKCDPAVRTWTINDFEGAAIDWRPVNWPNANPCQLALERQGPSKQLVVTLQGGTQDKAAIQRAISADLSSRRKIILDINNTTKDPVQVAFAIEVPGKPSFYESRWVTLRAGENNNVTLNLTASDFKSEATHWAHSTPIADLRQVQFLYILFYTSKPGKLYLDNISALSE